MKKRLAIYLALSLGLTWGVSLALTLGGASDEVRAMALSALTLVPALSVILTRLATGEGVRELYLRPNLQDSYLYYLTAWFLPCIVIAAGAALYFLCFFRSFDGAFSQMSGIMAEQGYDMTAISIDAVFYSLIVNNIFIAPLINAVLALGEELGWRGYLLPKLRETMPDWKAVLLTGAAWGLCKAPLAMVGLNYGYGYAGYPWGGMLAQFAQCVVLGVFLGFLTVRVDSVWPAALASGAITAFSPMGTYLSMDGGNPFIGPAPTGILGGLPWVAVAVVCFVWLGRKPKKKEPQIRLLNVKLR